MSVIFLKDILVIVIDGVPAKPSAGTLWAQKVMTTCVKDALTV